MIPNVNHVMKVVCSSERPHKYGTMILARVVVEHAVYSLAIECVLHGVFRQTY